MTIDLRLGSYSKVLADQVDCIDLIFTSPPYNIGSGGPRVDGFRHKGGKDKKSYGGITGYKDTLREGDYQESQIDFLRWCVTALKEDGVLVYNHKPRRKNGVMIHPMQWLLAVPDLVLMEEIIWDRRSTHNHDNHLFWPTTERLYVLRKADGRYRYENNGNKRDLDFRDDHWDIPLNPRKATDKNHADVPSTHAWPTTSLRHSPILVTLSAIHTAAVARQQHQLSNMAASRSTRAEIVQAVSGLNASSVVKQLIEVA